MQVNGQSVIRNLAIRKTSNAEVEESERGWRLQLSSNENRAYRLAQLDDYHSLSRSAFPQRPPFTLRLRARAGQRTLPGTWGFGVWNDPFGLSLGFGAGRGRLPALPNAAWFFFASQENHLALRNDQPGQGALAAVYRSPKLPTLLLAPAVLAAPLLLLRPMARLARKLAAKLVNHEIRGLELDGREWHEYRISWQASGVEFRVDGQVVLRTPLAPRAPLGLVLWLDNQYAAWRPDGRLGSGTLPTPEDCWVEIRNMQIGTG
ncbi:MAG: hypothetical protein WD751_09915 [Anaerolineales bacterium]